MDDGAPDPPISLERSRLMARIKGKNTRPEMIVRKWLHAAGFRFRLYRRDLPGKPDLVLPKWRLALFVHGCFWHQHPGCKRASTPKTREAFWGSKLALNVTRDARQAAELEALGWTVAVIWECETRNQAILGQRLAQILEGANVRTARQETVRRFD